ncbi:hypothetical protein UP10_01980 [Bradyrhizobium sp. LTSPM299]|nr:hypothetical protein UP10_01980 [Bradyrhizobium sp. LTSPM299]
MMTAAPARIVERYGSIRAFEQVYGSGELMHPLASIYSDPPNVWLTSFYGFRPEEWGLIGFTPENQRGTFIAKTRPGVLVIVYGATGAAKDEVGKVIGIQQCSHQIGPTQSFMSPAAWIAKERDPNNRERWNFAVKAVRAWRVTPESRMDIRDFAPEATASGAWQHIGSQGVPLSRQEALRILKLDLQEIEVYGETPILASVSGTARQILAPTKAGPVSQSPYVVAEAEGPKHLYILRLQGDMDAFLGEPTHGKHVVKAGFSRSPITRCNDFNRALPKCAFRWEVLHSGSQAGSEPYPSSGHAKAGELAMQDVLRRPPGGCSLGGEFFLAKADLISEAWQNGNLAAKTHGKNESEINSLSIGRKSGTCTGEE